MFSYKSARRCARDLALICCSYSNPVTGPPLKDSGALIGKWSFSSPPSSPCNPAVPEGVAVKSPLLSPPAPFVRSFSAANISNDTPAAASNLPSQLVVEVVNLGDAVIDDDPRASADRFGGGSRGRGAGAPAAAEAPSISFLV